MNVEGRNVLLTGATGGIGAAIARGFAARGARLVLSGRRADVLEPLAAETGGRAVVADLADRTAVDSLTADAGEIDILVANAALPADGPVSDYTEEQVDRALDVNLRAPIMLAKRLSEGMTKRGAGHIVLVSSLSGKAATEGSALYSATKFGLRGFGLALREDLRPHGIGVSIVFPGFIRGAGMFAQANVKLPPGVGTRTPDDVAAAVLRAVERDRAEIDVAPLALRLGSAFAGLAPATAATLSRRMGASDVATALAASEAHRSRR